MASVTVVVPSYRRQADLGRCLAGLAAQVPEPLEVLVALRADDVEGRRVATKSKGVRIVAVEQPGHLPPLAAALTVASGDVVAMIDDDAVPRPGWIECLTREFDDPAVAGLCGPVLEHSRPATPDQGARAVRRLVRRRSRTLYRAFAGLPDPDACARAGLAELGRIPVEAANGGNMAFRRSVLAAIKLDMGLNRGAAIGYEADLCLGACRHGGVWFHPELAVDHWPGQRVGAPEREERQRYMEDYSYNLWYIAAKHFARWEQIVFRSYMWAVGQRASPGVVRRLVPRSSNLRLPLAAARREGSRAGRAARRAAH
jgi:GT2 family glycosyltransferase